MDSLIQNSAFKVQYGRVPDVSKLFPEIGAVVINDLDGFIYQATRYGWGRGYDANENKVNLFFDFDGVQQLAFRLKLPSTGSVTIDWGDGTPEVVPGQDDTMITPTSTYSTPGQYYVSISGDVETFTWFWIFNLTEVIPVYGDLTIVEKMVNMELFNVTRTYVTGDITGFTNLLSVSNYGLVDAPNLYGDLAGITASLSIAITNNQKLTMNAVQDWSALGNLRLADCRLDGASMDRVIRSIKNGTDTLCNLEGNDLPSEAVRADFFTALNNGVQMNFSAKLPWVNNGPDLYAGLNALRQGPNEADAVAPFVATGLGSPNVFESQPGIKGSKFRFHMNANPAPSSGWNIQAPIPTVLDDLTEISLAVKHSGVGEFVVIRLWGLNNMGIFITKTMTDWRNWFIYAKARATDTTLYLGESSSTNDGEVFVDNLTVKTVS